MGLGNEHRRGVIRQVRSIACRILVIVGVPVAIVLAPGRVAPPCEPRTMTCPPPHDIFVDVVGVAGEFPRPPPPPMHLLDPAAREQVVLIAAAAFVMVECGRRRRQVDDLVARRSRRRPWS